MVLQARNTISTDILVKSFKVCGQHRDAIPEEISCLKENGALAEENPAILEWWQKTADQIGEVGNNEEEDKKQLFANEFVVVDESFVVVNHEFECD